MRYLFVTVEGGGSLFPQIALAQRVAAGGHQVRFLCCRSQRGAIEGTGFSARIYTGAPDFDMSDAADPVNIGDPDGPNAAVRYGEIIWFGPAAAIATDVIAEVEREQTDAIVIDYFAYGAAIAAERLGIPAAILWHTTPVESDMFNAMGLPTINAVRAEFGLPPDTSIYSAYHRAPRILALTTRQFVGSPETPANLRFVGPQLPPGCEPGSRTERLNDAVPRVLVCVGTSYQGQADLLDRLVEALGELAVKGLIGTGRAVGISADPPPNVVVRPWVDHCAAMPDTDLVVSHCGLGTIMTASAFGVPVLGLPLGRDQHRNAEHAAELGIARIGDPASTVDQLSELIRAALDDARLRERCGEVAADMSDGYDLGTTELEALVGPVA